MSSIGKNVVCFVLGAVFGTVGIKLLSSDECKKGCTKVVAAGLRAKDSVMKTVSAVQENVDDIVADAKDLNEARAAANEDLVGPEDLEEAVETAEA